MSFLQRVRRESPGEAGQTLAIAAAGMVAFIALVALSVDVGIIVGTRTDLQKAADAAAFAGAQNLPSSPSAASLAAESYAAKNDRSDEVTGVAVSVLSTTSSNDTIKVTVTRNAPFSFARVLGLTGKDVTATATVKVGGYTGGNGLVPWGFVANSSNSCYTGFSGGYPQFVQNQSCTLKSGAPGAGGDFGAVVLDQSGADAYRAGIANGSTKTFKAGDQIDSQTGDLVGPTFQGTQDRLARPVPEGCAGNDLDDVLKTNADGSVTIRPGCEDSGRIVLIPVVDKIDNPQKSTILGFAFMFMEDVKNKGGHTEVKGRFVKFVSEIPGGNYGGSASGSSATMVKLVE